MTLWIAWSLLVSALIAIAAVAIERSAAYYGVPRRQVWILALIVAAIVPLVIALRRAPLIEPLPPGSVPVATSPVVSSTSSDDYTFVVGIVTPPVPASWNVGSIIGRVDPWIAPLWLLASLVNLALLVRAVVTLRAQRASWIETDSEVGRVFVARDAGPAVVGVLRPRIVIPRWAFEADDRARALLLRHEHEHLRAGDSRVLFAIAVARALFPWNVAIAFMVRRLRLAIEIDCDARVVRAGSDAHAYGVMLLSVGERYSAALPHSAALSEPGSHLEARINAMTTPRPRRPFAASLPLAGVAMLALTMASAAPRPEPMLEHRVRLEPSPVVTPPAPPRPLVGNPAPRYPDEMRSANAEGQVLLTFTTNARGIPDTATIRVIGSTHAAFTSAVRRALPAWRYDSGGLVHFACRFVLQGSGSLDSAAAQIVVEGVPVWPAVITALPSQALRFADPKPLPGNPGPRYPDVFRENGTEGRVLAKFSTDSAGRPIVNTFEVVESTHDVFTNTVKQHFSLMRFDSPGLVRISYRFTMAGSEASQRNSVEPPTDSIDGVAVPVVLVTGVPRYENLQLFGQVPAVQQQQATIPNTPAGRVFKAWLDAVNSRDPKQLETFAEKFVGDTARRRGLLMVYDEHGPMDLLAVRESQESSLEFVVNYRRTGERHVGYFGLSSVEPPTLYSLRMLLVNGGRTDADPGLLAHLRAMRP
jgi:TonB family protein